MSLGDEFENLEEVLDSEDLDEFFANEPVGLREVRVFVENEAGAVVGDGVVDLVVCELNGAYLFSWSILIGSESGFRSFPGKS